MTNTNPLSARRHQYGAIITPQSFGAVGDGVADDTAAWTEFQAATGLKAVPAGQYRVGGSIRRFDVGCIGNGEFIDADATWEQMRGDRERDSLIVHRNYVNVNEQPLSPVIKTQTVIDFVADAPIGSFKHIAGAYHELSVDGYYNTQADTNQNFTVVGASALNRMAGLFGTLAFTGRALSGKETDNPNIASMGAPKQGVMFAETRHNTKHVSGGYSFNYEGYLINGADETDAVPYQNNDEYSFLPWTTNAKFTAGGNSPASSAILMHGLGGRHGYWNGLVLGASMWRIDNDVAGPAGTVAINMASHRASVGYADIAIKFRTNNRHLYFREGAKIRSTLTRFMNEAGAAGISVEAAPGSNPYIHLKTGVTGAPDGGSPETAAQFDVNETRLQITGNNSREIHLNTGGQVYVANSARFAPATTSDGTQALGAANRRWSTVYASTGAINTSDERAKTDIRDISEREQAVALRIKGLLKAYRFKDAVAAKGDGARIHFGVIAQEVIAAFAAEGLDAHDYALLCHDTWDAEPERVDVTRVEVRAAVHEAVLVSPATYKTVTTVRDDGTEDTSEVMESEAIYEDGEIIEPAEYQETRHVTPAVEAGDRYGIRYDELFAFMIAAL